MAQLILRDGEAELAQLALELHDVVAINVDR
jgi:hypothetical protein